MGQSLCPPRPLVASVENVLESVVLQLWLALSLRNLMCFCVVSDPSDWFVAEEGAGIAPAVVDPSWTRLASAIALLLVQLWALLIAPTVEFAQMG